MITQILLKNGIKEMLSENEEHFKQNIEQALAVKLNDSIAEVRHSVSNRLFENESLTSNDKDLNEFVNFIQNFKPGKYTFKDSTNLNITEKEMVLVKNLFESLSPKNRINMSKEVLSNLKNFRQHVEFAERTKELK